MKKTILSLMLIMGSFSAYGLDIHGDANSFTGNITSVTLTDEGGVINVVGSTGKYGKVWLTYNLKLDNSIYNVFKTKGVLSPWGRHSF